MHANIHTAPLCGRVAILKGGNMVQDMYGEVPVPSKLQDGRNFDFLKKDLRRVGSLTAD